MPDIKKYLNRDGLDEYNSLLPHSSGAMQEYVNDWLDEHPEATTTVQDGAISEPKLADKSVSLRTLADDTVHMLKGAILTGNLGGEVLTADDAYSAPPVALTVEGKSTQDGTPTPDAPVEIVSLEQVNLGFYGRNLLDPSTLSNGYIGSDGAVYGSTHIYKHNDYLRAFPGVTYRISQGGTAFNAIRTAFYDEDKRFISSGNQNNLVAPTFTAPANAAYMRSSFNGAQANKAMIEIDRGAYDGFASYSVQTVLLNLTHALRSLPDGTHDTLALTYLRPSTREGWAWYTPTLTVDIGHVADMGMLTWNDSIAENGFYYAEIPVGTKSGACLCSCYQWQASTGTNALRDGHACKQSGFSRVLVKDTVHAGLTSTEFAALMSGQTFDYLLATPVTTQIDPIELPVLPAPNFTIWNDQNTGMQLEYVRDSNIVIQNIEQAIADL